MSATITEGTVLEGVRAKVFQDRYSLKDQTGQPTEKSPEDMWRRVASAVASVERDEDRRHFYEGEFYDVMKDFKFVPGGRILTGAGSGHEVTYFNCYVIPQPEDSRGGIFDNIKVMTEIMARGGGVGVNLSSLRPRGSYIKTVNGHSSGPVSWAELYSVTTGGVIQQGGSRRGALMVMLDDDHPDIMEFVTAKKIDPLTNKPVALQHANISVAVSDRLMEAIKNDDEWVTQFPTRANVEKAISEGRDPGSIQYNGPIKARELWDAICTSAWTTAEPGVVFMERYNKMSNTHYYENIRCVNPCVTGETLVYTNKGILPVRELVEGNVGADVKVLSPTDDGVTFETATRFFETGTKPVFKLTTKEGYTVRLTEDHRVLTTRGWVEAGSLVSGDKIRIPQEGGAFGQEGSEEEGLISGWLVGDGMNHATNGVVLSFFGEKRSLAESFARKVNNLVGSLPGDRYYVSASKVTNRDEERVSSTRIQKLLGLGDSADKHKVVERVLRGSEAMQRGFLSALFSADGGVQGGDGKSGITVRLFNSNLELLENTQRLLLNFGIPTTIYKNRRPAGLSLLPDGKGGMAQYPTKAQHELVISKSNVLTFSSRLGFCLESKREKLDAAISQQSSFKSEPFLARFDELTPDGIETVYDLTEPVNHRFVGAGLVLHNCGEQGLGEYQVCNLGAINLSAYVQSSRYAASDVDSLAGFDFEGLARDTRTAIRFLDNVIDASYYFLPENEVAQKGTRRTGLGTMGLADMLIKLGIRYGSEDCLEYIDAIYETMRDAAYSASADLAAEKGSFLMFDRDKYMEGLFIKQLPQDVQDKIYEQGIRNAVLLTQAPTGTTSLVAGVSSGIEPVFSFAMKRVDRTGESYIYHPLMQEWKDEHPDDATTPDFFVDASELTPQEHVAVQSRIQKYTDSSISKTVNGPNHDTVEDVKSLYMMAYDGGCKGVTYYRDGSRDAVLTRIDEKQSPVAVAAAMDDEIRQRPNVLRGYTRNIHAPEGTVNITINEDEHGPFEVFINVGRAGSDVAALAEGFGRLISLLFRVPSSMSSEKIMSEVVNQLSGIGGSRFVGFGPNQVRSLPDALAKALAEHSHNRDDNTAVKAQEIMSSNGHGLGNPAETTKLRLTGNMCPECNQYTLILQEGCKKCANCGHSEC